MNVLLKVEFVGSNVVAQIVIILFNLITFLFSRYLKAVNVRSLTVGRIIVSVEKQGYHVLLNAGALDVRMKLMEIVQI